MILHKQKTLKYRFSLVQKNLETLKEILKTSKELPDDKRCISIEDITLKDIKFLEYTLSKEDELLKLWELTMYLPDIYTSKVYYNLVENWRPPHVKRNRRGRY